MSENVYAGVAMSRRAVYMYGAALDKGPAGQIGCGLGMTNSTGTVGLVAPTVDVTHTGQEEVLDGVRIVFQLTPGTECPAEMNFYFPERRALCMAENATRNLHNLVTLRGALVRDARVWASYLDDAIDLFAGTIDVAFASHHWPTWGSDRVVEYLSLQRDLYAYLHDQTLRLMNTGLNGAEAAEVLAMPPALEQAWHTHGYYGSVSHNVKAVYQRYLGWFDGNPARLWAASTGRVLDPLRRVHGRERRGGGPGGGLCGRGRPPVRRRAARPGGVRRPGPPRGQGTSGPGVRAAGLRRRERDVAQLLPHGRPRTAARHRRLPGDHRIGRAAVGPDRRAAARRHRHPDRRTRRRGTSASPSTGGSPTSAETHRATLGNGVLTHRVVGEDVAPADLTLTLTKPQMLGILVGGGLDGIGTEGDVGVVGRLLAVVETPDRNFAIVTP